MTYFGVLLRYILPPTLLLMAGWAIYLLRWRRYTGKTDHLTWLALLFHVALALLYTSPWDNYLVSTRVWWYDPSLVSSIRLGWVPIEEYTFFALQTLLTGSWMIALLRWGWRSPLNIADLPGIRRVGVLAVILLWLGTFVGLSLGGQPFTYLGLILAWALIPLGLQMAVGADLLWANWRFLLAAILPPTFYLWWVDSIALRSGTWTINPQQTSGISLWGLPIEEMLFFLMTNGMIVFGMTLALSPLTRKRLNIWWGRMRRAMAQT